MDMSTQEQDCMLAQKCFLHDIEVKILNKYDSLI